MKAKKKINRTDKYVGVRFQKDAYEILEQLRGNQPRGAYLKSCFFIVTQQAPSPAEAATHETKVAIGRMFALLGKGNISALGTLADLLSKQQAVVTPSEERKIHNGVEDLHELLVLMRYVAGIGDRP